ncbi:hypothetical protein Tco_0652915 [Tanacetum coccineum]|uniref:Uncharacterized protein n=1 Tax=Tanacetum coccineum TaxID=301880 RepID=A0ABQ4WYZ7_9ASTR
MSIHKRPEYMALSASCAQVMWMRTQLQDYGFNYNKIPLYCDSQSAIAISCNPVQQTKYQLADMFTKALSEDRFQYLVRRIEPSGVRGCEAEGGALSWKTCQGDSLNLPYHRIHKDGEGDSPYSS